MNWLLSLVNSILDLPVPNWIATTIDRVFNTLERVRFGKATINYYYTIDDDDWINFYKEVKRGKFTKLYYIYIGEYNNPKPKTCNIGSVHRYGTKKSIIYAIKCIKSGNYSELDSTWHSLEHLANVWPKMNPIKIDFDDDKFQTFIN